MSLEIELFKAITNDDLISVEKILSQTEKRFDYHNKALRKAISSNKLEIMDCLLKNGVNVNHEGNYKWTPLIYACFNDNIGAVKLLITHGANVNAKDNVGLSPLMCALMNRELFITLIKNGANIDLQDNLGETALIKAAQSKNIEAIKILLNHNADINVKDHLGKTAVDHDIDNLIISYMNSINDNEVLDRIIKKNDSCIVLKF